MPLQMQLVMSLQKQDQVLGSKVLNRLLPVITQECLRSNRHVTGQHLLKVKPVEPHHDQKPVVVRRISKHLKGLALQAG